MKKVVVTGGSGWIGKYVVHSLIQEEYEVHATYNKNNPSHLPCHWHKVNLLRDDEVKQFISMFSLAISFTLLGKQCHQHAMYLLIITIG